MLYSLVRQMTKKKYVQNLQHHAEYKQMQQIACVSCLGQNLEATLLPTPHYRQHEACQWPYVAEFKSHEHSGALQSLLLI